jgi:ribosome-associated protein
MAARKGWSQRHFAAAIAMQRHPLHENHLMKIVELTKQPIELFKILKFEGLVDSGGGAKAAISEGQVLVNGAVETRKRRQIVHGDTIEFQGVQLQVQCPTAP